MRALCAVLCASVAGVVAEGWPEEGRAAIAPTLVDVAPGETVQFSATLLPQRLKPAWPVQRVTWSVNGMVGGNRTVGRIDENGTYTAPASAPAPAEIHIGAETDEASNRLHFAVVRVSGASAGYRAVWKFSKEEIERSGLLAPRRIAVAPGGDVFIADWLPAHVLHFDEGGTFQGTFGQGPDGRPITHEEMSEVAVDPAGRVFAADIKTGPPRIEVYDPEGTWLFGFGPKGSLPHMVAAPTGLAFHPGGTIFVADKDAMRVAEFTNDGAFIRLLREQAEEGNRFNAPSDVAVDPAGDLFVSSVYAPCEKLRPDTAERLFAFAWPQPPDGLMYIDDVAVDQWGNAFLAVRCGADPVESGPQHGGQAAVLKYNNHGQFLCRIPLSMPAPKRAGITVDEKDRVYVVYSTEEDVCAVEIFSQQ